MDVRVEAAQISFEQLHEDLPRADEVALLLQVIRLKDRVAVGIVRIVAGQDLLHLVLAPRPALDHAQGILRKGLVLLARVWMRPDGVIRVKESQGPRA